jgi:hypothetical protein
MTDQSVKAAAIGNSRAEKRRCPRPATTGRASNFSLRYPENANFLGGP